MEEKKSKQELVREYAEKGMSRNDIASVLGLSDSTVRTYLARGASHRRKPETEPKRPKEEIIIADMEPEREPEGEKKYILAMAQQLKDLCGARDACKHCGYAGSKTCWKVFLGYSPDELTIETIIERFRSIYGE